MKVLVPAATKEVPGRLIDPFKDILCQLVKMIEQRLCAGGNAGYFLGARPASLAHKISY